MSYTPIEHRVFTPLAAKRNAGLEQQKSVARRIYRLTTGTALSPLYWLLSYKLNPPGLRVRQQLSVLAFKLLLKRSVPGSRKFAYNMLIVPMDSTRYFEFDFVWESLSSEVGGIRHYLDVSSPRLLPILFFTRNPFVNGVMINPDTADASTTRGLVAACGLGHRCEVLDSPVEDSLFPGNSFDVISSISVIEHVLDDNQAIRAMWNWVKPGGRLLVTVPCAAQAFEEYTDMDPYGLSTPGTDGAYFGQRFYDERQLEERFYSVMGLPIRQAVYGEKTPGTFHRNRDWRLSSASYPYWKEPWFIGKDFSFFNNPACLPGWGVAAMEFKKEPCEPGEA